VNQKMTKSLFTPSKSKHPLTRSHYKRISIRYFSTNNENQKKLDREVNFEEDPIVANLKKNLRGSAESIGKVEENLRNFGIAFPNAIEEVLALVRSSQKETNRIKYDLELTLKEAKEKLDDLKNTHNSEFNKLESKIETNRTGMENLEKKLVNITEKLKENFSHFEALHIELEGTTETNRLNISNLEDNLRKNMENLNSIIQSGENKVGLLKFNVLVLIAFIIFLIVGLAGIAYRAKELQDKIEESEKKLTEMEKQFKLPPSLDKEVLDLTLALHEEVQRLQIKYSSSWSSHSWFPSKGYSHKRKMEALLNMEGDLKNNLSKNQTDIREKISPETIKLLKKVYIDNYAGLEKEDVSFSNIVLAKFLMHSEKNLVEPSEANSHAPRLG
jgi:hypothetical protein